MGKKKVQSLPQFGASSVDWNGRVDSLLEAETSLKKEISKSKGDQKKNLESELEDIQIRLDMAKKFKKKYGSS